MKEQTFETILAKYPELIENGLSMKGRQVSMYGRRMDLLFEDAFQRKLLIELKVGPIKDKHIGQILSYEGMLLSADDPSIRVMLIGNRVPPNIRRALDHHGIAWQEISVSSLVAHLKANNDSELLGLFSPEELHFPEQGGHNRITEKAKVESSPRDRRPISPTLLLDGYSEALTVEEVRLLFGEKYIQDATQKRIYLNRARTYKTWANYIATLLLDREAAAMGQSERWFTPRDIKEMLKELMPCHYGRPGAKEGSLLTADVKVGSKYHLGLPCIEVNPRTGSYRFVGFKE